MAMSAFLLGLVLVAASPSPAPTPAGARAGSPPGAAAAAEPVTIFLVDNSASLPPLDPQEKRVTALEKMFTFLEGRPHRLVLFAARGETVIDDPSRYTNRGQWTDFLAAFERARDVMREYPPATSFRLVLLTDGVLDPDPEEWQGARLAAGEDLKGHVRQQTLALIRALKQPLYVILVGDVPAEGVEPGNREQAPRFVLDMVAAANGAQASAMAQRLSGFFKDDGLLLRKFIFRIEPGAGLAKVEPVVRRIAAPPSVSVELQLLSGLVLPLVLFLALMLGILVRSFPGPGDLEIVELSEGQPVHLVADKLHKTDGGWATAGLSLLSDAREAAATLHYQRPQVDLTGIGLAGDGVDALSQQLLQLDLDALRARLEQLSDHGTKEEKIYALNLDYMAKDFDPAQAERILTTPLTERRRVPSLDFLRAKAHLLSNDELRARLTEPRVQVITYGREGERKEVAPGATCRVGRYGFLVQDVARGGRKDVRVTLYYDRIPSLLGLKTWLPDVFQRVFRLRRSRQRVVQ
jgi:hypothetical protein